MIFLKQDVGLMGDVGKSTELASLLTCLAVEPGNVGLGFLQFSLELVVFLHQSLHVIESSRQLKVQLLELAFVHSELMLAGFERRRAAEPIIGVFYIEGIHGCALLVLFGYTVIEAQPVSEGEATSCRVLDWYSVGRTPERAPKRLSDFPSDFVKHGCAQLGIVAASARREASGLAGCRPVRLHGVLGVECSNHSVPTI